MPVRHRFVPTELGRLEPRVVLDAGFRGSTALIAAATERGQVGRVRPQTALQKVDEAFDAFAEEYSQARTIYFGTVTQPGSGTVSDTAFAEYTSQRVNLLAQDLIAAIRFPQGNSKKGNPTGGVGAVIARKINGRVASNNAALAGPPARGTLLKALIDTIPAAPATPPATPGSTPAADTTSAEPTSYSPQTTTFYTLAQDSAIEAAHASILNAISFYKLKISGKKHS